MQKSRRCGRPAEPSRDCLRVCWHDHLDGTLRYQPLPICRLTWNGKMDNWDFANYKYSSEQYEPEEWFFPGAEFVDGTVTGAMQAGMVAYEIR